MFILFYSIHSVLTNYKSLIDQKGGVSHHRHHFAAAQPFCGPSAVNENNFLVFMQQISHLKQTDKQTKTFVDK